MFGETLGQQSDLFAKIDNMLDRIHRERSGGSEFLDFKTGVGGMVEAEFLVQALQMRSGRWEPNWHRALRRLQNDQIISTTDADQADASYAFLRRCETVLRRFETKSVSTLPTGPDEQAKVAHWLGYGFCGNVRDRISGGETNDPRSLRAIHQSRRCLDLREQLGELVQH